MKADMQQAMDEIQLGTIRLFCLAAQWQSFTVAAQKAGVTPAAVSRAVARLEQRLGIRLFIRTTRHMSLTEVGQGYYQQCQQALMQMQHAQQQALDRQNKPSGTLRISAPTPYAHYRLLPVIPAFHRLYPAINLELHISNQNVDFGQDDYDLAIRGNYLPDSGLIARKLESAELIVVAAPEYLSQYGYPHTLDDLQKHNCIQYELPRTSKKVPWQFQYLHQLIQFETQGSVVCQDEFLATKTLAKCGAGLMQVYRFSVEEELRSGELIEVLAEYGGATRPFMLIYPYSRHVPLKVRVFIDFLLSAAGQQGVKGEPQ